MKKQLGKLLGVSLLASSFVAAAEMGETLGPNGEKPVPFEQVTLAEADKGLLKDKKYKAAILMHTTSDFSNALTAGAKEVFDDLNIDLVVTTDAEMDPNKQRTDVETAMALKPDIIISLVLDPVSGAAAFRPAIEAGVKLVFISNLPSGFEHKKDYVGIVTDDLFGMGAIAADLIADSIGNKGNVALLYHDANYYVTNQRDQAVKTNLGKFNDIKIVAERGIANPNDAETIASAIITQNPNINAIYAPWDAIAEGVVSAARAAGRPDIKVVTMDLGAANALDMVKGRNVAGIVTDLPYDLGKTLATMGAKSLLGQDTPAFVTVPAIGVTKDNIVEQWQVALRREPPKAVLKALK